MKQPRLKTPLTDAASYLAFTIVRDWEDLWVVSSQDDVELRQHEVRGILEPPQPEES